MDLSIFGVAQAILAALLVGFSKTGIAGLGILIIPLMAGIFPAKASVGVLLPMLIFGDLFAVAYYRRHAQWRILCRLLPWVMPGILGGYFALRSLSSAQLAPVLGGLVLMMIVLNLVKDKLGPKLEDRLPHTWWFSALIGLLAGFATMIGNIAGPIMSVYLISMGMKKHEFMGTGAWYYLIVNTVKVPFSASIGLITAASLKFNAMTLPFIAVGAFIGLIVFKRISQKWFTRVILILALIASIRLILSPFLR